jgi:hypothetical protein
MLILIKLTSLEDYIQVQICIQVVAFSYISSFFATSCYGSGGRHVQIHCQHGTFFMISIYVLQVLLRIGFLRVSM